MLHRDSRTGYVCKAVIKGFIVWYWILQCKKNTCLTRITCSPGMTNEQRLQINRILLSVFERAKYVSNIKGTSLWLPCINSRN